MLLYPFRSSKTRRWPNSRTALEAGAIHGPVSAAAGHGKMIGGTLSSRIWLNINRQALPIAKAAAALSTFHANSMFAGTNKKAAKREVKR